VNGPPRKDAFPQDTRLAAEDYLRLGLAPIPVPTRSKKPDRDDWLNIRVTLANIDEYFPAGVKQNIGVLNGEPSGNIVDVDADCPEYLRAAPLLLPLTGLIFGRKSAPASHRIYHTDSALNTAAREYTDSYGRVLIELRGTGGMTIYPPSLHRETGECIEWHTFSHPGEVALKELERCVAELAVAALIARHWPVKGSRDKAAMALAGALTRAGWPPDKVARFIEATAIAARDEEARQRAAKAHPANQKQEEGKPTTGWPTLRHLLGADGDEVIHRAQQWLGITAVVSATAKRTAMYRPLPPFTPFPLNTLPPVLSDLVAVAAKAIGCDPALVACPALAVAAGCIGNARIVILKRGWTEPCVLWSLTVAESGGHKTPAYHQAVDPLMELQMEQFDKHKALKETLEEEMAQWQAALKNDRGEKPKPLAEPRTFVTSDTTIEALGELLEDNPHGMLVARDELDAWFKSFTRYSGKGGGTDRPQWLELHRAGTLRVLPLAGLMLRLHCGWSCIVLARSASTA
jgi:hypothetical protein